MHAPQNLHETADPRIYNYTITSPAGTGGRIPGINESGTTTVDGGACKDVYGVIDAGLALACDYDTLTIIVWTAGAGRVRYLRSGHPRHRA